MAGNTFGRILRLTTFGESHGAAIGGILDGCPAGLALMENDIQKDLDLRRPGSGASGTRRRESDKIQLLSGLFEGKTTGTPIGFVILNENQRSGDYGNLEEVFRPGHADWSYFKKYNGIRDYRGGGRASGRETACRVAGGAIAKKILSQFYNTHILAAATSLGGIPVPDEEIDMDGALKRPYYAASDSVVSMWDEAVERARKEGETLGGIVRIVAANVPPGLGEPVFDRLDATIAHAVMSVGAVKGVEIGSGFNAAGLYGSQNNDEMFPALQEGGLPSFGSNNAGGVLGGISSGQNVIVKAAIKPIASIAKEQNTVDRNGEAVKIRVGGRHDLSAIPRVVPVLSAMTALAIADAVLLQARMGLFT